MSVDGAGRYGLQAADEFVFCEVFGRAGALLIDEDTEEARKLGHPYLATLKLRIRDKEQDARKLFCTVVHYVIPCHTVPYHTMPYHTIQYHTILYRTLPYLTILY